MCDRKAVIKNADMSEEMQQDAVDCATQALEKFNIEKVSYVEIPLICWHRSPVVFKTHIGKRCLSLTHTAHLNKEYCK